PGAGRRVIEQLLRSPLQGESAFNMLASRPSIGYNLRSRTYGDPASATPQIVDHYYALAHQRGARFVPAAFVGGALNCDLARDLPFLEAPLLVLWGERAQRINPPAAAAEYVRLVPNGRSITFANSGLLPHEEEPDAVCAAIEEFIGEERAAPERSAAAMVFATLGVFKSYDVRGIYPDELDESLAYAIGRAFVAQIGARRIAIGRDMRPSGAALFEALARGVGEAGADVVDVGLVSTDALYFAVGAYGLDGGAMITASHNPAQYNGIKFTGPQAQALSLETGLAAMRDRIAGGDLGPAAARSGTIVRRDVLDEFAAHCLGFIDRAAIKPFTLAIDAGNGMAGLTVPRVFARLPCRVIPLYFELDGTFPNHPASPIEPENMADLQRAVLANGCDLGVAFDGDADRMFIVDERGALVGGDIVTALVAINTLRHVPGEKILYNLICSRSVPEAIERAGGIPVRSQVGHSLIKATMRAENIVFGGEHSGHFYFRDNWFADSGMIALLQCLEVFSNSAGTVSETIAPIDRRVRSGEINSRVDDIPGTLAALEQAFAGARIDHLDGVTVAGEDWWLNVRPSNTEPLLRLNVEGDTREQMEGRRDQALAIIRGR
ncbi:MAG: hypothetical protein ACREM2_09300, partial [Vulcanimicrobiaceae bacterium]